MSQASPSSPTVADPFPVDTLLQIGVIVDRGQLAAAQRAELERRVGLGSVLCDKLDNGVRLYRSALFGASPSARL